MGSEKERDSPILQMSGHTDTASPARQWTKCVSHSGQLFEQPSNSSPLCQKTSFFLASQMISPPLSSSIHHSWGPEQFSMTLPPCSGGVLSPSPLLNRSHFAAVAEWEISSEHYYKRASLCQTYCEKYTSYYTRRDFD